MADRANLSGSSWRTECQFKACGAAGLLPLQTPALAGYDDQTSARSGPYSFPDSEPLSSTASHGSVVCNNTLELASATTRWLSNPFFNEQCHSFDESRPSSVQGRCYLKSHQLDTEPSAPPEHLGDEQPAVHKASQLVQAAKAGKLHLVWASHSSSSFRHSVQPSPTARDPETISLSQYSAASASESGHQSLMCNKFRSMSLVKNLVENYERQGSLKRSPAPRSVSTYPEADHFAEASDSFTGLSKEYSLPQEFINEATERDKDASADHSFNPLFGERADKPIVMQLSKLRSANKQEVDQLNLTIQMRRLQASCKAILILRQCCLTCYPSGMEINNVQVHASKYKACIDTKLHNMLPPA